ncbi:MAG: hypothetical protein ABIH23_15970 [bacterium]
MSIASEGKLSSIASEHRPFVCDVLAEEEEYDLLLQATSRFLTDEPENTALLLKHVLACLEFGETGLALHDIEKVRELRTESSKECLELASLYLRLDLLSDALKTTNGVLEQDSTNYDARRLLARVYFALHDPAGCEEILRKLEKERQFDVYCYCLTAVMAYRESDYDKCLRYGARLLIHPKSTEEARHAVVMSQALARGEEPPAYGGHRH